jgi:hypothetical protein
MEITTITPRHIYNHKQSNQILPELNPVISYKKSSTLAHKLMSTSLIHHLHYKICRSRSQYNRKLALWVLPPLLLFQITILFGKVPSTHTLVDRYTHFGEVCCLGYHDAAVKIVEAGTSSITL